MSAELTPGLLAWIAGALLSLVLSYVPGLNAKFALMDPLYKRLIMLGLLLLSAAGIFGLSCAGRLSYVSCDTGGVWILLGIFAQAAIANQATFALSPAAKVVTEIKLGQKALEVKALMPDDKEIG